MNLYVPDSVPPEDLTLLARLAWEYFFGERGESTAVQTYDDHWIIIDESCDLSIANIFQNTACFVDWLKNVSRDHLADDPAEYLRTFTSIPELITDDVTAAMKIAALAEDASGPDSSLENDLIPEQV